MNTGHASIVLNAPCLRSWCLFRGHGQTVWTEDKSEEWRERRGYAPKSNMYTEPIHVPRHVQPRGTVSIRSIPIRYLQKNLRPSVPMSNGMLLLVEQHLGAVQRKEIMSATCWCLREHKV